MRGRERDVAFFFLGRGRGPLCGSWGDGRDGREGEGERGGMGGRGGREGERGGGREGEGEGEGERGGGRERGREGEGGREREGERGGERERGREGDEGRKGREEELYKYIIHMQSTSLSSVFVIGIIETAVASPSTAPRSTSHAGHMIGVWDVRLGDGTEDDPLCGWVRV